MLITCGDLDVQQQRVPCLSWLVRMEWMADDSCQTNCSAFAYGLMMPCEARHCGSLRLLWLQYALPRHGFRPSSTRRETGLSFRLDALTTTISTVWTTLLLRTVRYTPSPKSNNWLFGSSWTRTSTISSYVLPSFPLAHPSFLSRTRSLAADDRGLNKSPSSGARVCSKISEGWGDGVFKRVGRGKRMHWLQVTSLLEQ
jgi:hypothetical protein